MNEKLKRDEPIPPYPPIPAGIKVFTEDQLRWVLYRVYRDWHQCALKHPEYRKHRKQGALEVIPAGTLCDACKAAIDDYVQVLKINA